MALGNTDAAINLGDLYFMGWGVPKDREKAAAFYRGAAERKHPVGECRYASVLEHGHGVHRDLAGAKAWRERALATGRCKRCGQCRDPLDTVLKK